MKISINDKRVPSVLLLPVAKNDKFDEVLTEISSRTGTDVRMLENDFGANAGEMLLLYAQGNPGKKLYLIGLGAEFTQNSLFKALRKFTVKNKKKLPKNLGLDLRHVAEDNIAKIVEYGVEGILQGLYTTFTPKSAVATKTKHFGTSGTALEVVVQDDFQEVAEAAAERGRIFAETRIAIMDLVNKPSNLKAPMMLADIAKKAGKACGFSVKVKDDAALIKEGLHAIRCIGMGSDNPPALILLEYKPKDTPLRGKQITGLVGKGITFDTGGYSIKPSDNMGYMKSDMGGAAAVLGTFMAVARLGLPVRLVGAIPTAENMVSARAVKPGDVTQTYSGKTIEITDTDAEGRVVLADGLAYLIKNKKPDVLIDLATLTGAIVRSLGYSAAGLFSENKELVANLQKAAEASGDPVWHMPMFDAYAEGIKSDVADVKNYASQPPGGAIWAAKFLETFTDNHPAWAHMDIAGVAFGSTEFGKGKTGTAFGVRLLVAYLEQLES